MGFAKNGKLSFKIAVHFCLFIYNTISITSIHPPFKIKQWHKSNQTENYLLK